MKTGPKHMGPEERTQDLDDCHRPCKFQSRAPSLVRKLSETCCFFFFFQPTRLPHLRRPPPKRHTAAGPAAQTSLPGTWLEPVPRSPVGSALTAHARSPAPAPPPASATPMRPPPRGGAAPRLNGARIPAGARDAAARPEVNKRGPASPPSARCTPARGRAALGSAGRFSHRPQRPARGTAAAASCARVPGPSARPPVPSGRPRAVAQQELGRGPGAIRGF